MTKETLSNSSKNQKNIGNILQSLESIIKSLPEELQAPFAPILDEFRLLVIGNISSIEKKPAQIIQALQSQIKLLLEDRTKQEPTKRNHKGNVQNNQEINKLSQKIQDLESKLRLSETTVKFQNKKIDSQNIRINFKTAIETVLLSESYTDLFKILENLHKSIQLQKVHFIICSGIEKDEKEPYLDGFITELLRYESERIIVNDLSFGPHLDIHQGYIRIPKKYCENKNFTEDKKDVGFVVLSFRKESSEFKKDSEIQSLINAIEYKIHTLGENNILGALTNEVYTDGLTGIANRKMIDKEIDSSVNLAIEKKQSIGLFFLDLNSFKVINDTYGHDVGDAIIIKFAQHLNVFIQKFYKDIFPESTPVIARQGGDEFQVILPEIGLNQMEALAHSFYTSLKELSHSFEKDGETITLPIQTSIGGVIWDSQNFQTDIGTKISDFFIQSDKNLYQAKAYKGTDYPTVFLSQL